MDERFADELVGRLRERHLELKSMPAILVGLEDKKVIKKVGTNLERATYYLDQAIKAIGRG